MAIALVEEWIQSMVLFAYREESNNSVLIDPAGYHSWREISEPGRRIREE